MNFLLKLIKIYPNLFSIFGFKDLQPDEIDERDDIMGAEPRFDWKVLKPDGDWTSIFRTLDWEVQNWMDCTGHAMKNILEMLYQEKWGIKINISAAYINGMAGTSKWKGNSMKRILESVRKNGWVTDEEWPEANRWKIIPQEVVNKGKERLSRYHFGYDSVYASRKSLDEAVKYSPLYVGGYAWYKRGNEYISMGSPNHCFTELMNTDKIAGDSYRPHIKDLAENFKLYFVRRIYLERKNINFREDLLNKGNEYVIFPEDKGKAYKLTTEKLIPKSREELIEELSKKVDKDDKEVFDKILRLLTDQGIIRWLPNDWYEKLTINST